MPDLADKHEIWGTFSVMDHRGRGAFLAEVILYDRLVIPVPPDPEKAESEEDRAFARKQWQRWVDEGWQPERQLALLEVLRPVAEPIEWDRQHHQEWAGQFETYAASRPTEAANMLGQMMAGWLTGQVLLDDLPAKAAGAVAVAPFRSLSELTEELGIRENQVAEPRVGLHPRVQPRRDRDEVARCELQLRSRYVHSAGRADKCDDWTQVGGFNFVPPIGASEDSTLYAVHTIIGAKGQIFITFAGSYNLVSTYYGSGSWVITGGTGCYHGVHGQGTWTADASTFPYIRHTETGTIERR